MDFKYFSYMSAPLMLTIAPIVGLLIGRFLDDHFGTTPYLAYIFLILGIAAGIRELYKVIKRFGKDDL